MSTFHSTTINKTLLKVILTSVITLFKGAIFVLRHACCLGRIKHHLIMKIIILTSLVSFLSAYNFHAQEQRFSIQDYLQENPVLNQLVEKSFNQMDDTARIAQLIMPAAGRLGEPNEKIERYIQKRLIGGILLLNGSMEGFTKMVNYLNDLNFQNQGIPFFYSADAEPSLINRKIEGSTLYKKASEIKTIEEVQKSALVISEDLKKIGINFNFAPVVDMPPNKTVGYRSMGTHEDSIVSWAKNFIQVTQEQQIIATAKHFPGHGFVSGDTHQKLVYIEGEMKEVKNYPPLIENGVLSVMVAHLAVKNNLTYDTKDNPASISRNIVTDLLRNQLGFKGLIVTDAMNMGGVSGISNASLKAVQAGCDLILMPLDVEKTHQELLEKYRSDVEFRGQVDSSVKRILRMKHCLNLLPKSI
jgi:beta-N-acetylhexosaminidase